MSMIGFIGLGRMGLPMAANMQRKGFHLIVNDINPKPVKELVLLQARPAATIAEVVEAANVIFTMLPNSAIVSDIIGGPDGVLAHAKPGTILVDMSTVSPETTDHLAKLAQKQGCSFVDAPVGRLAQHADKGESLFMVGASDKDYAQIKPMLEAMGTTLYHCGPVGSGTRTKLVNNYLAVSSCQLNAEALALSQAFGLELERTLDVLYGTTATNGQLKIGWPVKVLNGDTSPGFTIDLAHKDLSLIVEAANNARVPMPIAAAARETFSTARSRGFGGQDFSAMVDALCDLAQIKKPRLKK